MKIFLDTNIFMEYVSCQSQYETVRDIFDAIEDGKISAFISTGGLYTTVYLITRLLKESYIHRPEQTEKLRTALNGLLQLASLAECSNKTAIKAINDENFTDIEDGLQYHCAIENNCEVLVTINIKDFKNAKGDKIKILSPKDFVKEYL